MVLGGRSFIPFHQKVESRLILSLEIGGMSGQECSGISSIPTGLIYGGGL